MQALGEARSSLEGQCQHLSAPRTCPPAGAVPGIIPSLTLGTGASGVGFCPASTSEVPTGCCGGAVSSQVLWEVMFLAAMCWALGWCRRQPQHWENQCL